MPDILKIIDAECKRTAANKTKAKKKEKDKPNHATIFVMSISIYVLIASFTCDSGTA